MSHAKSHVEWEVPENSPLGRELPDEAKRTRRSASGLGRLALLLSLAILFLAVALVRGFWF
jgi:hypothetical protein